MFKVGDKVILKSDIYSPTPRNPAVDSEFSCIGIIYLVTDRTDNDWTMRVHWRNGHINSYRPKDLELVSFGKKPDWRL